MTATRCAKPEYQLNVDILTLEYFLYHAITSQFAVQKAGLGRSDNEDEEMIGCNEDDNRTKQEQDEAARTLIMFDSFMKIFRHHHNYYSLSPGKEFNIILLELLVLPHMYTQLNPGSANSEQGDIPSANKMKQQAETLQNLQLRQAWLRQRQGQSSRQSITQHSPPQQSQCSTESALSMSWKDFQARHGINSTPRQSALFDMLPRFMALSATIVPIVGEINDKWMQIACEFMLQASLELLDISESSNIATTDSLNHDPYEAKTSYYETPGLTECFAWGFNQQSAIMGVSKKRTESEQGLSEAEQHINNMFSQRLPPSSSAQKSAGAHSTPPEPSLIENASWTRLRHKYLSEFYLSPNSTTPSDQACQTRLKRLQQKFPRATFDANLLRFLEHLFTLNCSEELHGKPILVQIEHGHLNGLDQHQFKEFCDRVGISKEIFEHIDVTEQIGIRRPQKTRSKS